MDAADPDDVLTRPAALPDAVLRYADHEDGVVDVHLPAGPGPHPLVVLLHGGFWKQAFDRRHATRPMARALVEAGCVVAAPEYRRVGGRGGWPATGDDVAAALAALPDLLAGLSVTTTTTTVSGHSAGGHLALWLAGLPARCRSTGWLRSRRWPTWRSRPASASATAPPRRCSAARPRRPPRPTPPPTRCSGWRTPTPRPSWSCPHGVADTVVPVGLSRGLAARFPRVDLREQDCGHFELIDPHSAVWPAVREALTGAGRG